MIHESSNESPVIDGGIMIRITKSGDSSMHYCLDFSEFDFAGLKTIIWLLFGASKNSESLSYVPLTRKYLAQVERFIRDARRT